MLSINDNAVPQSDHREHAWALRTIGQALANLRPEYLEVEFSGQLYLARGRAGTDAGGAKKSAGKIFGALRRREKRSDGQGRESPWFERRYTLYEINRLDDQGLIQRKNAPLSPDIYVLGERLRTIGKMIEAKDGRLLKLTLDNNKAAFTYRDAQGTVYHEEHSTPSLYRSQQDSNLARGTGTTRDPWTLHVPRAAARADSAAQGKFRLMSDGFPKRRTRWEDDER
jgi:hypothetical protein